MFTMVHLALPAHVMCCPNILFDWKCVSMGVQHLEMLFYVIFKHLSNNVLSSGSLYQVPNSCNYFFKRIVRQIRLFAFLLRVGLIRLRPVSIHLQPAAGLLSLAKKTRMHVPNAYITTCAISSQLTTKNIADITVFDCYISCFVH